MGCAVSIDHKGADSQDKITNFFLPSFAPHSYGKSKDILLNNYPRYKFIVISKVNHKMQKNPRPFRGGFRV